METQCPPSEQPPSIVGSQVPVTHEPHAWAQTAPGEQADVGLQGQRASSCHGYGHASKPASTAPAPPASATRAASGAR
jgi:hypothetical protein